MAAELEPLKREVVQRLSLLRRADLEQVAERLEVQVPEARREREGALLNAVLRHLTSEDIEDLPDEGLELFTTLNAQMEEILHAVQRQQQEEEARRLQEQQQLQDRAVAQREGRGGPFDHRDQPDENGDGGPAEQDAFLQNNDIRDERQYDDRDGGQFGGDPPQDNRGPLRYRQDQPPYAPGYARGLPPLGFGRGPRRFDRNENDYGDRDAGGRGGEDEAAEEERDGGKLLRSRVSKIKLREFKITGGMVASGEKSLDYASLCYQMQEAVRDGYPYREVRSAVIKAMKAGSSLRRYFEGEGANLTDVEFAQMLRDYHEVEDSAELLTQMANSYQGDKNGGDKEKEKDFVLRMLDMKRKIITLSKDEGFPMNEKKVRERFIHALSVGFNKDTIRLAVERIVNRKDLRDEELLREVCGVVARDTENKKKTKSRRADVNATNLGEGQGDAEDSATTDNAIMAALKKMDVKMNKMSASRNDEIAALKVEINQVREGLVAAQAGQTERSVRFRDQNGGGAGMGGRGGARGGFRGGRGGRGGGNGLDRQGNRYIKCEACEAANLFCTHCSICGEGDHRRRECERNPANLENL